MAAFLYRARDQQGLLQTGRLDAADADEALAMLQRRGLIVVAVSNDQGRAQPEAAKRPRRLHARVTVDDRIMMCQQMATLLEAGVPLLRSLQAVSRQLESRTLLTTLSQVRQDIEGGWTFRNAIAKHPQVFSIFWVNLIETGEASGHLAQSLKQLAQYHESVRQLNSKAVTAMTYPAVLIVAAIGALFFFSLKVIPMFNTIFSAMHIELPLLTKIILGISNFVRHHVVLLILGMAACGFGVFHAARLPQGKRMLDWGSLHLPLFRQLFINLQLAQFTRGLATLLATGVPILASLEIMERSASNGVYAKAIGEAKDAVREGKPMVQPLEGSGLFPAVMVQMVQVGEEIGELPKMLDRSAAYFEERVNVFIERMTSLFEPIAIVVMGAVIGTLVISMFLPIFSMSTGGGQM